MATAAERRTHERWLSRLTSLPTAAGREDRVIEWIEEWTARRKNLVLRRDDAGNLFITRAGRRKPPDLFITAHLDHPAFVVRRVVDPRTVDLEFRGGVHDPYFDDARIEIFDATGKAHRARLVALNNGAKPFKRVTAQLAKRDGAAIAPGDVGRWLLRGELPRIRDGILLTHACDDLAAVAAALATMDLLRRRSTAANMGVLLTRAEEVGFVGTLAACVSGSVPMGARLLCLENSRSFPESPIGDGPILRVGDRISVFSPSLTNRIAALLDVHQKKHPEFKWQRKLMPGGACEASAFSLYGYESTCLCLPLGNYHNMTDIDAVVAGQRPARVGPEYISVDDFHRLVEMLIVCITKLDNARLPDLRDRFEKLLARHRHVLE
jgi:endoglucanase